MPFQGGTGSIPVPNFFLIAFLSNSCGMWAVKGIRDTIAFPLQPDNSQDDLRFEVSVPPSRERLPLSFITLCECACCLPFGFQPVKRLDRVFGLHNDLQVLFRGGESRA